MAGPSPACGPPQHLLLQVLKAVGRTKHPSLELDVQERWLTTSPLFGSFRATILRSRLTQEADHEKPHAYCLAISATGLPSPELSNLRGSRPPCTWIWLGQLQAIRVTQHVSPTHAHTLDPRGTR